MLFEELGQGHRFQFGAVVMAIDVTLYVEVVQYVDPDPSTVNTAETAFTLIDLPIQAASVVGYPSFYPASLQDFFVTFLRDLLDAFDDGDDRPALLSDFPAYMALRDVQKPYWLRVISSGEIVQADMPLSVEDPSQGSDIPLGLSTSEFPVFTQVNMLFNSAGDPISSAPDKFMLSIGAA